MVLQVVEGQHLSLPTCPKRRVVSTFCEWVRCFSVYASTPLWSKHAGLHVPVGHSPAGVQLPSLTAGFQFGFSTGYSGP